MTVIAWDGKTLAADRMLDDGGIRVPITKIKRFCEGVVLAAAGPLSNILEVERWYGRGAIAEDWPACQTAERYAELIVATLKGVKYYEFRPRSVWLEAPFYAWGSGREIAIGAMEMGADARTAVEVANKHCATCGLGVDAVDLR